MELKHALFSFQGRLNRKPYWLRFLAMILVALLFLLMAGAIASEAESILGYVPLALVVLAMFASTASIAVRRLHDRDKSGWMLLVFYLLPTVLQAAGEGLGQGFVAVVLQLASLGISVWALVELGFLRGTPGPNRYGPDPLAS